MALAAAKLLNTVSRLNADLIIQRDERKAVLTLNGAATFIRLPKLATQLEEVPPGFELHIEFQDLDYIDHSCLDLLMTWAKQHESTDGRLVIDWESLHARFHADNDSNHIVPAVTAANGDSTKNASEPSTAHRSNNPG